MKLQKIGILKQLGYSENDLKQLETIEKNTPGFEKIKNHLLSLNDKLKHLNGFIAFSNSVPHLKIKLDTDNNEFIKEAEEIIKKWADKYKVELERVKENVFYIKRVI